MKTFQSSYDQEPQQGVPIEHYHQKIDSEYNIEFIEITSKTIDKALLKWFVEDHPIIVRLRNNVPYKVPAIWSTAERFAMMNADKHIRLRDEHGTLMVPLISVKRESEELIAERTAPTDKAGVTNFTVYVREYIDPTTMTKRYQIIDNKNNLNPQSIVERIEITAPKIVRFTYNISCWTKYMTHMNEMLEHMVMQFGQHHAIYASETLWFGAYLNGMTRETNEETLGGDERIFKSNFTIVVEAPLIKEENIRRHLSLEKMSVDINVGDVVLSKQQSDAIRDLIDWNDPYRLRR